MPSISFGGRSWQATLSVAKLIGDHDDAGRTGEMVGWIDKFLGQALTTLLTFAGGICGLVFSIMYARNIGVLASGAKRWGTPERQDYDALRERLDCGGSRIASSYSYARRLTD